MIPEPLSCVGNSGVTEAIGAGLGGAEIVSIQKPPGQAEEVIALQGALPGEELVDVDRIDGICASQLAGMGGLIFAVDPVARQHDNSNLSGHLIAPGEALP